MYRTNQNLVDRERILKEIGVLKKQISDKIILLSAYSAPNKISKQDVMDILRSFQTVLTYFEKYVENSRVKE